MVDYCTTKVSVASRVIYFVNLILKNRNKKVDDFETFDLFIDFLYKNRIKEQVGFNKNKNGYLETLKFIYSLKEITK